MESNTVAPKSSLIVEESISSLESIIAKLPSPISVKRACDMQSSETSIAKKICVSNSSPQSSPDMRKNLLVKKVHQKLHGEISCNIKDISLDDSIQIVMDSNDNESHTIVQHLDVGTSDPNAANVSNCDLKLELPSTDKQREVAVVKKPLEVVTVKRTKRLVRLFKFCSNSEEEKDEFQLIKALNNQTVPRVINGRKPFVVVPGIDYGLEAGEDVMDTEEDQIEVRLARNEKYEMDSFVCDTGYLSDEEMVETPTVDKVVAKVKQQRRANNIKSKLKFEKLTEPEVLGCNWRGGKGGKKFNMRKWQAIVFTPSPIPTSFTKPIKVNNGDSHEQPRIVACQVAVKSGHPPHQPTSPPDLKVDALVMSMDDYCKKYRIKYLVKNIVSKMVDGTAQAPSYCSTPVPSRGSTSNLSEAIVVDEVLSKNQALAAEKDLLNKYVAKYVNKFKYHG